MSQKLTFDEIEMWHGHPDHYMNELEEILNTLDDSDTGYFIKVDLKYPAEIKRKQRKFLFVLKVNYVLKTILMII